MNDATSPNLILGGGFVGLFTALHLSHQRCKLPTILIDLSRQAAYLEMLPTPVRNFKATAQWLTRFFTASPRFEAGERTAE